MDPKLISLAVNLYAKLQSGNAVARRLDVSHSTAYRLLRAGGLALPDRHGPEVQKRKKALSDEKARAAAADYASGMSAASLTKKYSVSMWAIRTAAKDAGVHLRTRGGRHRKFTSAEIDEVASLYVSGWSQAQIAAKFGSSQVMVSRLLVERGVQTRKAGVRGSGHGSWKGGRTITTQGYVNVWLSRDDPLFLMADSQGRVQEHRLVMARELGRPLLPHETVHHIDGDRQNNKPSNLQLRFGKHGNGVCMACADCGSHRINYKELA